MPSKQGQLDIMRRCSLISDDTYFWKPYVINIFLSASSFKQVSLNVYFQQWSVIWTFSKAAVAVCKARSWWWPLLHSHVTEFKFVVQAFPSDFSELWRNCTAKWGGSYSLVMIFESLSTEILSWLNSLCQKLVYSSSQLLHGACSADR